MPRLRSTRRSHAKTPSDAVKPSQGHQAPLKARWGHKSHARQHGPTVQTPGSMRHRNDLQYGALRVVTFSAGETFLLEPAWTERGDARRGA